MRHKEGKVRRESIAGIDADDLAAARMKIAMYTSSLPMAGRKPGGVDVLIHRLANALIGRGHDVAIWTYSTKPDGAQYRHVQLLPTRTASSHVLRLLVAPLRLNGVAFGDADVVHLHGDDWFYLRRLKPTVRTLYGSALYEMRYAPRARRALSQAALVPLEMLSCGLATRAYGMIPNDGPLHRLNGYLPGAAAPASGSDDQRSERPSVLFVGTWRGRKRGALVRDAFIQDVLPDHPTAELWCVSDECEESESVRWVRTPTDAELEQLFRQAWVFCLPSRYEGFGLPYVEAMSYGVPVIASRNPGAAFITRGGFDGLLVEDADLGSRLSAVLGDEECRTVLAERGRARAIEFTWARCAERHEDAYLAAITGFRSRARADRVVMTS